LLQIAWKVGSEFKEIFEEAGGDHWQLVESLNVHPIWIECLATMVKGKSAKQKQEVEANPPNS
jgi:ferrochelatase